MTRGGHDTQWYTADSLQCDLNCFFFSHSVGFFSHSVVVFFLFFVLFGLVIWIFFNCLLFVIASCEAESIFFSISGCDQLGGLLQCLDSTPGVAFSK